MTVLLSGSAPATPVVVEQAVQWQGIAPLWTGWDGSTWSLSDPAGGVVLTRGGTRGLTMPPYKRFTSESPSVAGSRFRGRVALEREVFWPLYIFTSQGSQAWVERDRAFWRTMDPDRPGVWSVMLPDGQNRSLTCRFVSDGDPAFELLPVGFGWARYGVSLVAEQPFWQGPSVVRNFKNSPGASFFGTGASPFTISSGNTLSAAQIDNPGDEDAYLVYTITGPSTSVTVRGTVVPFSLAAGEVLVIDTAPSGQTAITGAGVDRTGELGVVNFAPVAPGQQVPLSLAMTGDGMVSVSLTPLYRRAW